MDRENVINKMIHSLEVNSDIRLLSQGKEIYIHSIDSKEGYSYITIDGTDFDSSREAIEWAVCQFQGFENIGRWE